MSRVAIVMTGGTITMKIFDPAHGAFPMQDASDIIEVLNDTLGFQNLVTHKYSMIPSPSMTLERMRDLKSFIDPILEDPEISGVVITHGTDALEETAFYLDLVHTSEKPVIVTGAMKNASEIGYDGFTNLVSAIYTAQHPDSQNKGVLVVMNYEIHAAWEVTKTHTLNLDTFKSLSFGPLGIIDGEHVIYYRLRNRWSYRFQNTFKAPVPIITTYAGIDADMINQFVNKPIAGIVIEAMGRGNVPPQLVEPIERLIAKEIPVIVVSRVPSGRVFDTYGYPGGGKDLIQKGAIFGTDLTGLKARILLMVALGNAYEKASLRSLFTYQ